MKTLRALSLLSVGFAAVHLGAGVAFAQQSAAEGEFSVQRFEPAPGSKNYLSVEGARMEAAFGWSAGVMFDYASRPFVVRSCVSQEDCSRPNPVTEDVPVVSDMFTWNLMGAITPLKFLQVGLRLPLVYANGAGFDPAQGTATQGGLGAFAVGDPTLEGKVRVYGEPRDPVVIGAALDLSAPLGRLTAENSYIGNSAPVRIGVRGIFDGSSGPLSFGANVRAVILPGTQRLGTTEIGPVELRYGVAVGYKVSEVFRVLAEGFGATGFKFSEASKTGTNSFEIDGAVQVQPLSSGLVLTAGGGAGILQGVGVPAFRALAGVAFVSEPGDEDGDGIDDKNDACPSQPEDKDGFEDDDGCPDDDNDRDGIPDIRDKCPDKAEVINGLDDEDGCPDEVPDRDKDGIPDENDKCPDQPGKVRTKEFYGCPDRDEDGVPDPIDQCPDAPEDTDGFEDTDGCPDPDNDQDGIPDEADECIDEPEVINGYKDEDGCPDEVPDRDKDGIADDKDQCPDQPENYNGFEDEDGCPDRGPNLAQVSDEGIKILQRVEFAAASDKIQGAPSFSVLDAVVSVLKVHPEIFQIEVAGHTDNVGPADMNRTLSQKRAETVVAYLVSKGIASDRLIAKGYGPDKPIADNLTNAGRQKNRRVEFNTVKSPKKSAAPATPAPASPTPGG
ncbi:OmpA family protein [Chondromyces crocatus]|uniref:Cell envelope biogenesis protein OmpA n=1 Tax=Chondromyces crocatus TaxID=52 RepID=A0A0K1EEP9_CHOCO|nr:OmpA family protein [Chondromyces crocatus]AKT39053.1 cell envelope biogenesis protein OmpA [Chondromyces crocatus]